MSNELGKVLMLQPHNNVIWINTDYNDVLNNIHVSLHFRDVQHNICSHPFNSTTLPLLSWGVRMYMIKWHNKNIN